MIQLWNNVIIAQQCLKNTHWINQWCDIPGATCTQPTCMNLLCMVSLVKGWKTTICKFFCVSNCVGHSSLSQKCVQDFYAGDLTLFSTIYSVSLMILISTGTSPTTLTKYDTWRVCFSPEIQAIFHHFGPIIHHKEMKQPRLLQAWEEFYTWGIQDFVCVVSVAIATCCVVHWLQFSQVICRLPHSLSPPACYWILSILILSLGILTSVEIFTKGFTLCRPHYVILTGKASATAGDNNPLILYMVLLRRLPRQEDVYLDLHSSKRHWI